MRITLARMGMAGVLLSGLATPFILSIHPAHADTRVFLIETPEGYGIDTCLSGGEACGESVAAAWCRSHDYDLALDFGRVERDRVPTALAGAASSTPACLQGDARPGETCPPLVAITCSR